MKIQGPKSLGLRRLKVHPKKYKFGAFPFYGWMWLYPSLLFLIGRCGTIEAARCGIVNMKHALYSRFKIVEAPTRLGAGKSSSNTGEVFGQIRCLRPGSMCNRMQIGHVTSFLQKHLLLKRWLHSPTVGSQYGSLKVKQGDRIRAPESV